MATQQLKTGSSILNMKIRVTRAVTGKVEDYYILGTPIEPDSVQVLQPSTLEENKHGCNSSNSGS